MTSQLEQLGYMEDGQAFIPEGYEQTEIWRKELLQGSSGLQQNENGMSLVLKV